MVCPGFEPRALEKVAQIVTGQSLSKVIKNAPLDSTLTRCRTHSPVVNSRWGQRCAVPCCLYVRRVVNTGVHGGIYGARTTPPVVRPSQKGVRWRVRVRVILILDGKFDSADSGRSRKRRTDAPFRGLSRDSNPRH